jgi:hypothetical protein
MDIGCGIAGNNTLLQLAAVSFTVAIAPLHHSVDRGDLCGQPTGHRPILEHIFYLSKRGKV